MIYAAFTSHLTPFSYLIKLVTKGQFSHCGVVIDDYIYQSSPFKGVIKQKFDNTNKKWTLIKINKLNKSAIETFILNELGCGYDWFGVARFILPKIKESKTRWFCSEFLTKVLISGGYKFSKAPALYDPSSLYKAILKAVNKVKK
jgi:hypothetical protein